MENKGNKKKIDGLLSLLSNEATKDSIKLLKKNGYNSIRDHKDLELKLADLYRNADDKLIIEKEFCEIHPHKNFILKYSIKEEPKEETNIESPNGVSLTEEGVKEILKKYIGENTSNCSGNPNCNCNSNFSGNGNTPNFYQNKNQDNTTLIVGIVALVSVFGLLIHYKNK